MYRALTVTIDAQMGAMRFEWAGDLGAVRGLLCPAPENPFPTYRTLDWAVAPAGVGERDYCGVHRSSSGALIRRIRRDRPVPDEAVSLGIVARSDLGAVTRGKWHQVELAPGDDPWAWIGRLAGDFARLALSTKGHSDARGQHAAHILTRVLLGIGPQPHAPAAGKPAPPARAAPQRNRADSSPGRRAAAAERGPPAPPRTPFPPAPPVRVRVEPPAFALAPGAAAAGFELRERAALWWISNQADDLLCWPYCRLERLDYQVRTALRVLGPLRGRALLSDEVGLGKTIEAGLVAKELLVRGMIKRFLVLTTSSLVQQWREELREKFGLEAAAPGAAPPESFWAENSAIVCSLHTVKHPANQAAVQGQHWDLLVVDEAHHLRNRGSQAWQAVNALPRQFLLLLTATPVQNSVDELYNLVTLLQPGQLPPPAEFRARFVDPKRPRQPREPQELRRLLGQVMIRNTRAGSGVDLPPRRAETVLFAAPGGERSWAQEWEKDLRERLGALQPGPASLWGRLLLQAAGSSPAAWRSVLEKFPDREAARRWAERAPSEALWRRKCGLLRPLASLAGGIVVFTQFRRTQEALAEDLRAGGAAVFAVDGSLSSARRHEVAESFRGEGRGALLLTPSGAEGRNLQFCHRLANFDLPWNPMVIEQRIGRLHRLGQRHPVEIYNFVQEGTLQEHLLRLLQEKLNLFELVVGETGLVLGERLGSEEFAEEVLRRWRGSPDAGEALRAFGEELAQARERYGEIKALDATLFAQDYES